MIFAQQNDSNIPLDGVNAGPHAEVLQAWSTQWGTPSLLLQHGGSVGKGYLRNGWAEWPGHLLAGAMCARWQGRVRDPLRIYACGRVGTVVLPLLRRDLDAEVPSEADLHEIAAMHERIVGMTVERLQNLPVTAHQALELRMQLPTTMRPWEKMTIARKPMGNALRLWSQGAIKGSAWDLLAAVRSECLRTQSRARMSADAVCKVYRNLRNMVGGGL